MQLTKEQIKQVIDSRVKELEEKLLLELKQLGYWSKDHEELITALDTPTIYTSFYGVDATAINNLVTKITTIRSVYYSLLLEMHETPLSKKH